MIKEQITASLIFAAGKGSRMKGYEGNKTLLPLVPEKDLFSGRIPILIRIIENLPPGPKALVVNHRKDDVIKATNSFDLTYCEQPVLNGTGGAMLAAIDFIKDTEYDYLLVTMGDTPLVKSSTFTALLARLEENDLVVLGFRPDDKKNYGVLETENGRIKRIIEWKYWSRYSDRDQKRLTICNAGIYAARKEDLLKYLELLSRNPHTVIKEREGKQVQIKEYFITDMIELMHRNGLEIGYEVAEDEDEVMGVDDVESLKRAQELYGRF